MVTFAVLMHGPDTDTTGACARFTDVETVIVTESPAPAGLGLAVTVNAGGVRWIWKLVVPLTLRLARSVPVAVTRTGQSVPALEYASPTLSRVPVL